MAVIDRVWPAEKNVGGMHRTARYVGGPILVVLGLGLLTGSLPGVTGTVGPVVGALLALAGVVSLVEAHTQKCPGYAVMGIDTCELAAREPGGGHEESA